jgi:hypothetical protein
MGFADHIAPHKRVSSVVAASGQGCLNLLKYAGSQSFQNVFAIHHFRLTRRRISGCDSVFDIILRLLNRPVETFRATT